MTRRAPSSYLLGATCVSFDSLGRVLINRRRSPDRWELPGGFVKPGEWFPDAAERETFEETRVRVKARGIVGIYQHPSAGILAAIFIADYVSGEPAVTAESSAVEWSGVDDALNKLDPLYRPRLESVLNAAHTAAFRVHEGSADLMAIAPEPILAPPRLA
jgi:8-oxo-dGTP diphosphatase